MFSNIAEIYSANHLFWNSCLLPMLNASRDNRQPLNPILMKDSFSQVCLSNQFLNLYFDNVDIITV